MSVNLVKGQAIDLSKTAGGNLHRVNVTIGWKANTTSGADFDPDVVAFVCGNDDKALGEDWAVTGFGNKQTPNGEVSHSGDDRKGGTGETITIDLDKLPALADSIMTSVTLYHAAARKQNFGSINGLTIRIDNADTGDEIATCDLSFDDSVFTAINFGKFFRRGDTWGYRTVGDGYNDGLKRLFEDHGIAVGKNEYDEGVDN